MAGLIGWHTGGAVYPVESLDFKEISVEYTPFQDGDIARAKRHEERAEYWTSMGKPEFAKGSMRKAAKARQRYREFDMWRHGALPAQSSNDLLRRYLRAAEDQMRESLECALMGFK